MFKFKNLDNTTRLFMLESIAEAEETGRIYKSRRFNPPEQENFKKWLVLLKKAAEKYDEVWLTNQLKDLRLLKKQETAHRRNRRINGELTLAEGQFNQYYMLGLCKRAKSEDISQLQIYRARESKSSRATSNKLINTYMSVTDIEIDLNDTEFALRKLGRVDSGISVKLP